MKISDRQAVLFEWVKQRHGSQVRKYTNRPYWTHLWSVAKIIDQHIAVSGLMIELALCHDLLEDTSCDFYEFVSALESFGYNEAESDFILYGVQALTAKYTKAQYPHLDRAARKRLERERLSKISGEYQTVKYADIIHNVRTVVMRDPDYASVYLKEKEDLLAVMDGGDTDLYLHCRELVHAEQLRLVKV